MRSLSARSGAVEVIEPVRIGRADAAEFVRRFHRHHDPDQGDRFCLGAWAEGRIVGVAVVGRPRAPLIDQQAVVEVTRCCVEEVDGKGYKNACSWLYSSAAEQAKRFGFRAIITYTLSTESGSSLRALGWWPEQLENVDRHEWSNRDGRIEAAHGDVRWLKLLNYDFHPAELVLSKLQRRRERQRDLFLT